MLAVSPLRSSKDENQGEISMERFSIDDNHQFPDFGDATNFFESINFDDLFVGINDEDLLRDLEMDPDQMLPGFSDMNTSFSGENFDDNTLKFGQEDHKGSGLDSGPDRGEVKEVGLDKRDDDEKSFNSVNKSVKEGDHRHKSKKSSSSQSKNCHGKRKVKVDWTPELHRRFVQAVEQLGVDKAVPSRILELMGIDCLTRHNIASHLQKYRSHRKHLLAREAEAASWSQRRKIYGGAPLPGGGSHSKRPDVMNPWRLAPTMGFPPPMAPTPPPPPVHQFRPLHVWGHPSPPPPSTWRPHAAHPPVPDHSFWHHYHQRIPHAVNPGTVPYCPQPLATTSKQVQRFPGPPVAGIPPQAMYKMDPGIGITSNTKQSSHRPPFDDFHPSKESVDAAIGDVLLKPWLPLPLGLRPPSTDSVMMELQRQGIPKIPPSCG